MIMKIPQKQHFTRHLIRAGLVLACIAVNAQAGVDNPVCDTCPEDPDSFLTLLERSVPEDADSARAYYEA